MPTINVTGTNPYEVVIDHGLDETIARTAAAAPGATQVALIYQTALIDAANSLANAVSAAGLEMTMCWGRRTLAAAMW